MEMEVVMPVPPSNMDFNFDSACSSPYMTAPSSPQRFGNFFFSAPTSPSRVSSSSSPNRVFNVEDINNNSTREDDGDFEFNFSGQLEERTSLSADELFDGGKIRPLNTKLLSSSSGNSSEEKHAGKTEDTQKRSREQDRDDLQQKRGRERFSSSRKGSRSLSPMRVSDIIYEQDDNPSQTERIISSTSNSNSNDTTTTTTTKSSSSSYASTFLSAISFSKNYRKWKLKDLLLFRSASEGRPAGTHPVRTKYAVLSKKESTEDVKNASFRSTDSSGSVSRRRSQGPAVSAHELHYTANRAVAEEMKRKTFLPYKQGLLGCLGFNPGVHDISRGVGSLTRV